MPMLLSLSSAHAWVTQSVFSCLLYSIFTVFFTIIISQPVFFPCLGYSICLLYTPYSVFFPCFSYSVEDICFVLFFILQELDCFSQVASNWILQFYEALGAVQFCSAMPIYLSLGVGLAYSCLYLDFEILHALRL
jgi:hypothetical protein